MNYDARHIQAKCKHEFKYKMIVEHKFLLQYNIFFFLRYYFYKAKLTKIIWHLSVVTITQTLQLQHELSYNELEYSQKIIMTTSWVETNFLRSKPPPWQLVMYVNDMSVGATANQSSSLLTTSLVKDTSSGNSTKV